MRVNNQLENFKPAELIKEHFYFISKTWPQDNAANWSRELIQRIEKQELSSISIIAIGKMGESLADGQRHSAGISKGDLYITISTFSCSVEEVRRMHYPKGYLIYLDRMVGISRQENPECHWLHFQFFYDGESFWVQFTLFPNKVLLTLPPLYHFPVDLLNDEEKRKLGLE